MFNVNQCDCILGLKELDDMSIEVCITDIPYGKVNRSSNGLRNLDKGDADILTFDLFELLNELNRVISGSVYIYCGKEQMSDIYKFFDTNGWSVRLLMWEKTNPSPMNAEYIWLSDTECCVFAKRKGATFNGTYEKSVLKFPTVKSKYHPTQKPVELLKQLVKISSNPDDTIIDPCMGSGSTGVACLALNRNFIGFDINRKYVDVAIERLSCVKQELIW